LTPKYDKINVISDIQAVTPEVSSKALTQVFYNLMAL